MRRAPLAVPALKSGSKKKRGTSDDDDAAAWVWPLAFRGPIETFDEYINDYVGLAPVQRDPTGIEGLLIDFRYASRDEEYSRRTLLCWLCWRDDKRIYIRGYCPFREAMRTFRVDRMFDLLAMQSGRYVPVDDVASYFAAYAADRTDETVRMFLDSSDD